MHAWPATDGDGSPRTAETEFSIFKSGDDLAARVGVGREDAMISQHVKARRRDQGSEAGSAMVSA